jgi:hypothetical protein
MLTAAQIQNFVMGVTVTPPVYPGTQTSFKLSTAPLLQNVTNFIIKEGTYTANNDYLYLAQGIPPEQAPNFIFLFTSGVINLTISAGAGYLCAAMPIFKAWSLIMPAGLPYLVNGIYFEGRTGNSAPAPMPQGTPVDYCFIAGQATLS